MRLSNKYEAFQQKLICRSNFEKTGALYQWFCLVEQGCDYEGPKVDNSIFCHLTVEKQNKRFRKMHFSSFLLFW